MRRWRVDLAGILDSLVEVMDCLYLVRVLMSISIYIKDWRLPGGVAARPWREIATRLPDPAVPDLYCRTWALCHKGTLSHDATGGCLNERLPV